MDDLEIWIALGTAVVALLVFALRWYNKAKAVHRVLRQVADQKRLRVIIELQAEYTFLPG